MVKAAPSAKVIAEFAHELRAPLGGIEAMVEMLSTTSLDRDQMRVVEALRTSCRHLRAIAGRVLGEAGPGAEARTGLRSFILDFVPNCEARARSRGLAFDIALHASLEARHIHDAPELRQVLENLIDNACRLAESGRITLAIDGCGDDRIVCRVIDQGPGLAAEEADRLIRQGGGIAGRSGGAGLGLMISGRLVGERGGSLVGGPNAEGRGAEFRFDWPCEAHARETAAANPEPPDARAACLIVDDHPASRLVLRTILRAAGYACSEAADIAAAMAVVASEHPDIVLTDLRMPGGHGATLIEQIAALPKGRRPRIVVVSADEIDPQDGVHCLIDRAIRKPIAVRAVLEAVASLAPDKQRPAA